MNDQHGQDAAGAHPSKDEDARPIILMKCGGIPLQFPAAVDRPTRSRVVTWVRHMAERMPNTPIPAYFASGDVFYVSPMHGKSAWLRGTIESETSRMNVRVGNKKLRFEASSD
jgi:hypothetical protein